MEFDDPDEDVQLRMQEDASRKRTFCYKPMGALEEDVFVPVPQAKNLKRSDAEPGSAEPKLTSYSPMKQEGDMAANKAFDEALSKGESRPKVNSLGRISRPILNQQPFLANSRASHPRPID